MLRLTRKSIVWIAASTLLALPARALPAAETEERVPITDPMLLESLGFEPDAINVYATPQALQELKMDPAERAAVEQARLEEYLAAGENSPSGGPYGTGVPGFSTIGGMKFVPSFVGGTTTVDWVPSWGRYCLSGTPIVGAQLEDLPHGAKLEGVRLWYNDASDEAITTFLYENCQPDSGPGVPIDTVLGSNTSTGSAGPTTGFISTSVDIDGQSCFYRLQVRLGDNTGDCEGQSLAIFKASARWRRQISPAPVTATFNDVPIGHPFFRHIEALAASGITSGCGGDSFCPNGALTRGQMAVFLATALGLHWGSF